MSKHTPGPWICTPQVERQNDFVHLYRIASEYGERFPHKGEAESNARLIASAPDLYQHVTEYLELCEKMKNAKDSEERADYLSIMVGLKGEMKRTIERVKGKDRG